MALLPAKCKRHQKVSNQNCHLRRNFLSSNNVTIDKCQTLLLRELLDRLLDCFTQAPFTPSIKYFLDICFVYLQNIFPHRAPVFLASATLHARSVEWDSSVVCSLVGPFGHTPIKSKQIHFQLKLGHLSVSVVVTLSWLKTISWYPSNFWGSPRWVCFLF